MRSTRLYDASMTLKQKRTLITIMQWGSQVKKKQASAEVVNSFDYKNRVWWLLDPSSRTSTVCHQLTRFGHPHLNTGFVYDAILILHTFKFTNQSSNLAISADFKVIVDSINKFNTFNIVFK